MEWHHWEVQHAAYGWTHLREKTLNQGRGMHQDKVLWTSPKTSETPLVQMQKLMGCCLLRGIRASTVHDTHNQNQWKARMRLLSPLSKRDNNYHELITRVRPQTKSEIT